MNWNESYWFGGIRLPDQVTTATRSPARSRRTFQPGALRTISDSTSGGACMDTDTTSELRSLGTVECVDLLLRRPRGGGLHYGMAERRPRTCC